MQPKFRPRKGLLDTAYYVFRGQPGLGEVAVLEEEEGEEHGHDAVDEAV